MKKIDVDEGSVEKGTCFVACPIGEDGSPQRIRSNQVMKYIIEPILGELGYEVERADGISEAGHIGAQVISRVVNSDLVIADLTGSNPNVFYELAIRHAVAKPYIQLMQDGEDLPFDVSGLRTIFFDYRDLDSVADAKEVLKQFVLQLQGCEEPVDTPISQAVLIDDLTSSKVGRGDGGDQIDVLVGMMQNIQTSLGRLNMWAAPERGVFRGMDSESYRDTECIELMALVERLVRSGRLTSKDLSVLNSHPGVSDRYRRWVRRQLSRSIDNPFAGKEGVLGVGD